MVKINIKYEDESEFWFETSTSAQISDLARDVNVIFKNKHLLQDLVKEVEKFMDQQTGLLEKKGLGTSAPEETASPQQEESGPVCLFSIILVCYFASILKDTVQDCIAFEIEWSTKIKKIYLEEQCKMHNAIFKNYVVKKEKRP